MRRELFGNCINPRNVIHGWLDSIEPGEKISFVAPSGSFSLNNKVNSKQADCWIYYLCEPQLYVSHPKAIDIIDVLKPIMHLASIELIKVTRLPELQELSCKKTRMAKGKGHQLADENSKIQRAAISKCEQQSNQIEVVLKKRVKPLAQIEAPSMQDLIARALRLYAAKEYESVLDIVDHYSWMACQSADILNAAGASAFALKFPQRGTSLYRRATEIMPTHYDAWNNLGIALSESGAFLEAEEAHRRAIELRPQELSFHADLARLFSRTDRIGEAQEICNSQLEKNPESTLFLGELGAVYTRQGEFAKAREQYAQILKLKPRDEAVALNCASKLAHAGYWDDAETIHRKAIRFNDSELARFHLSLLLLVHGRFEEGWELYEARSAVRKKELPQYQFPVWKGESIVGKSLLISFEQGFGDEIMMARYATELKKAGASRIAMVCRRPLAPLFKTLDDAEVLTPIDGDPVITLQDGEFDYWTLPFEIPRYLQTHLENIPTNVPYLKVLPSRKEKWATIITKASIEAGMAKQMNALRVGLVWKGSTLHAADAERSLSNLGTLAKLWELENVQFYSLQKGQGEDELEEAPKNQPIVDLGRLIEDFADTAAIIEQMDLIISVDTAVVHIAGALNKPCWVMIPYFATDWRWMLGRSDTPWYPSLRLFRQDCSGNWRGVIEQIQMELLVLAQEHQHDLFDEGHIS